MILFCGKNLAIWNKELNHIYSYDKLGRALTSGF